MAKLCRSVCGVVRGSKPARWRCATNNRPTLRVVSRPPDFQEQNAVFVVSVAEVEAVEAAGIADVVRTAEDLRFVDVTEGDVGPHGVEIAQVEKNVVALGHLVNGVGLRAAHVEVRREDRRQRRIESLVGRGALDPLRDLAMEQAILFFLAAVLGRGEVVPAAKRIRCCPALFREKGLDSDT